MIYRAALILIAVVAAVASPAIGEPLLVPIWHYNVTLDLGSKEVEVEPQPTTSSIDTIARSVILRGDAPDDWAGIFFYQDRSGKSPGLEQRFWNVMHQYCKVVRITDGAVGEKSGLVSTGEARVEHGFGPECYAGAVRLGSMGRGEDVSCMVILGHFENETLNRHLIGTVRVDYQTEIASQV